MSEKKTKEPEKKEKAKKTDITPWQPTDYMREMDRMFRGFTREFESMLTPFGRGLPRPWSRWFELPDVRDASADLIDTGKEYRVCAEVPGIPKEKLNITLTPKSIDIQGEAKTHIEEEKEGFVRQERGYSRVQKSLTFPDEVIPDKAVAKLRDGILEVKVPKKSPTEIKKHKIEIK